MWVACLERGCVADACDAGVVWSPELGHDSFGFVCWASLKG
jgi:hypothetical protein